MFRFLLQINLPVSRCQLSILKEPQAKAYNFICIDDSGVKIGCKIQSVKRKRSLFLKILHASTDGIR